jgi:hypothetical protein
LKAFFNSLLCVVELILIQAQAWPGVSQAKWELAMSKAQRLKAARRKQRELADKPAAAIPPQSHLSRATSWFGYPVVYLLLAIAVVDVFTFADSDLWGHIRFGQAMLKAGHMIEADPYSYSAPGHLWRNHEWLSEVIFALVYNSGGVFGLELLKLCCSAAMVLFLALALAETQVLGQIQGAVVMLTAPAMATYMQMRPQLFTFTLLAALVWLLASDSYRRAGRLWLAVPIMGLWANFHGGYIAGLGALGAYAAVASIEAILESRDWRRVAHLSLIVVASVLATLVNPYGVGAWYAVGHALTNPLTRRVINDWMPITVTIAGLWKTYVPAAIIFIYALGFLSALLVGVALVPRGNDLPLVVIAIIFSVAALAAMRNLALAVIITSVPLARHLGLALQQRGRAPAGKAARRAAVRDGSLPGTTDQPDRSSREYVGQLFAAAAAILLISNGLFSRSLESVLPCPAGAVAFMKEHHLHGNVLSIYNWGEYLIWHLAPESKVFIDGRYDTVYPPQVIKDYFVFESVSPDPERVLKAYKHDFALVPPETDQWVVISRSPDWKLLYRDENAGLFAHSDFTIKGVKTPVVGEAPPDVFP